MAGANCYTYNNGFLHSKGMIVDGKVLCYGTANMDIRSFALNFEVNAVIYDEKKAQEMVDISPPAQPSMMWSKALSLEPTTISASPFSCLNSWCA